MDSSPDRPQSRGRTTLHLIRTYQGGGSERRLEDAIRGIPSDHVVLAGNWSEDRRRAAIPDIEFVPLPQLSRNPGWNDLKAVLECRRALAAIRPTVLMTHQAKSHIIGRLAARGSVPTIVSLSMSPSGEPLGKAWWMLERRLGGWTDAVVTVGEDLANEYTTRVPNQRRPTVIRSSIPARDFLSARSRPRGQQRTPCFIGALDERKGAHILPEIASRLRTFGFKPLLVAGEGPLRSRLESSDDIVLVGHVESVPSLLAESDVLVLPSRSEGLPQVLVQAAMAGVPFVTTQICGAQELIAMGSACSIQPRDADAFAAAAHFLTSTEGSTVHPDAFRRWDPSAVADDYSRLYMRVTDDAESRRGRRCN